MERWANAIKIRREKFGLTQQEFADSIGVARQTVYDWELGHHKPQKGIRKILHEKYNFPDSIYDPYEVDIVCK